MPYPLAVSNALIPMENTPSNKALTSFPIIIGINAVPKKRRETRMSIPSIFVYGTFKTFPSHADRI
jgi:hypothetical protein